VKNEEKEDKTNEQVAKSKEQSEDASKIARLTLLIANCSFVTSPPPATSYK
jgi:hypothetical protein